MNGKSFSKIVAALALTGLLILNIGFSVDVSLEDGWVPVVDISAITQTVKADDPSSGCPSTHHSNEALRHRMCIQFWKDKLKCVSETNMCCDPTAQTTCGG